MEENGNNGRSFASLILGICSLFFATPWLTSFYGTGTTNWFTDNLDWLLVSFGIVLGCCMGFLGLVLGTVSILKKQRQRNNRIMAILGIILGALSILGGLAQAILAIGHILCHSSAIC